MTNNGLFAIAVLVMLCASLSMPIASSVFSHSIVATADAGGIIEPSGTVDAEPGEDYVFAITANPGYDVTDVLVNGSSVGAVASYTFYSVSESHTIHAEFAEITVPSSDAETGNYLGYVTEPMLIDDTAANVIAVQYSVDGNYLFYSSTGSWWARNAGGNESGAYEQHLTDATNCYAITTSHNGTYVVFAGAPEAVPGFDIFSITGGILPNLVFSAPAVDPGLARIDDVAYSVNDSYLAIVGDDDAYIYNTTTRTLKVLCAGTHSPSCCAFSQNLTWFAAGGDDSSVADIYDIASNFTRVTTCDASLDSVYDVAFSPDSKLLAVAGNHGLRIFNTTDFGSDPVTSSISLLSSYAFANVVFSPCGNFLYASQDTSARYIRVYNTTTWELLYSFLQPVDVISCMVVNRNNTALAYTDDSTRDVVQLTLLPVNRTYLTYIEYNNISISLPVNLTGLQYFVIPVSAGGVSVVHNNIIGTNAFQVFDAALLTNNTFYYDVDNSSVVLCLGSVDAGDLFNWTLVSTHDICFDVSIPQYREVGDYIIMNGCISDSTGTALNGVIATTRILTLSGINATSSPKWNCTAGDYFCTLSTNTLEAGVYCISIEFPDPITGETLKRQSVLYLSCTPGAGVHVSTNIHFSFYNNNTGYGLSPALFRVYASSNSSALVLVHHDAARAYTGSTLYYRIDDYLGNQVYPATGTYRSLYVADIEQQESVPIEWYDVAVKNLNSTIMHFSLANSSVYYNATLFPGDTYHFYVLPMEYNITIAVHDAYNGTLLSTTYATLLVAEDCFYIASGYTAHIYFSLYNTNEGLGLPWDTLKYYVNDNRLTDDRWYHGYINQTVNLIVKDYYNFTMYNGNFTLNATYNLVDLGLTFHSWLFSNSNEEYYIISLLREGAARWFERGITPVGGECEFMLPSGNYTLRIYDGSRTMLYNANHTVNRSLVYVIAGTNLTTVVAGLSVVQGQLLELAGDLDYALMPDAIIWARNPVTIFSVYDRIGQELGTDVWKVCPALNVIATTRNATTANSTYCVVKAPTNGTTLNGTVYIIDDILYLSGNSSVAWVNLSYANGTLLQNTTYVPGVVHLTGETIWINASCDVYSLRETTYSSTTMFYWNIYNSTVNPGNLAGRAGYHSAGISVSNPFNESVYDVYVYAGFSDKTTPDYNTVTMYDVDNGISLTRAEDFKVSGSGIEFKIQGGLSALETRNFNLGYYKDMSQAYYYDDAHVVVYRYDTEQTLSIYDDFFNCAEFMWINDNALAFRGSIRVKFGFDADVDVDNVHVFDMNSGMEVDESDLIVTDEYVWISSNTVGTVAAGGTRSFAVYFTSVEMPGVSLNVYHLSTPFAIFAGIPISAFVIIMLLCIATSAAGAILIFRSGKMKQSYVLLLLLGFAMMFIFWILQAKGV